MKTLLVIAALAAALVMASAAYAQSYPAHTQGYRFITDTLAPGGAGNGRPPTFLKPSARSFSWSAAAIGAAAGAGLVLVLAGSSLFVVRRARIAI